jgi:hypothetical protein
MNLGDRRYALTLASDVAGDATSLELDDVTADPREPVGEVRYADASGALTVSLYRRDVPLAAVEHLLAEARRRLPPAVAVVVDPAFGDGLAALAARVPVWVADTPDNRAAAERVRAGTAAGPHEVTTFRVDPSATPAAWCAGVLPAIMDHHGGDGPHPRAGAVEVVGAEPIPELARALAAYGFTRVEPGGAGFRASVA